jgi:SulP family sulfate permease
VGVVEKTGSAHSARATDCRTGSGSRVDRAFLEQLRALLAFFARPVGIIRNYNLRYLQPDLVAGLTVAVIALPQAMAYALVAELPPQMGIYAAIVGAIVGALWGSSDHLQTGPSNAASLLVLSILLEIAVPGTSEYVIAAGLMAFLVGVLRLVMGLARLGMLVNFVSDAVIIGFTAGAGVLIFVNQVRHLLRLPLSSASSLWVTLPGIVTHLPQADWISATIGLTTIVLIVVLRRSNRKLPGPLIAMVVMSVVVGVLRLDLQGVRTVGALPRRLPPWTPLPVLDLELVGQLATGSLAVAAIGLVEAMSIARGLASYTGQRIDANQEFVGQGLASMACGFLSGYTISGSFIRSAVNFNAGARTPMSNVFGGLFVLLMMLAAAPLAAYVPFAALAGVIILAAFGLIDRQEMARIWRSGHGDRFIMIATLLATLTLPLQFAVLTGILTSLAHYLVRTSTPRVRTVVPDHAFRHFEHRPEKPDCPQLGVIEILGALYFGAVNHVEDYILHNLDCNPEQRYLLLRMHSVDHCDISGIHALETIRRAYSERGGDIFLVGTRGPVLDLMKSSGYYDYLGADHFLSGDDAIGHLFHRVLDPAVCIYECDVRVFSECQNLPKSHYATDARCRLDVSIADGVTIGARALWAALHDEPAPVVIDVREPREFRRGHVPGARSIPLPALLADTGQVPREGAVTLVCRGGRRSGRAVCLLRERGYDNATALRGGMLAWKAANLLEAID